MNSIAFRGDHASDRGTDAPIDVRHRCDPFEDKRELRGTQELVARRVLERNTFRLRFDWYAVFRRNDVVSRL